MNKLTSILTVAIVSVVTLAVASSVSAKANSELSPEYRAVYCYNGGSYWEAQKAAYPKYYQANDAYFQARYGDNTRYCPAS